MKEFIRQIGFDDGHFEGFLGKVPIVGTVIRGKDLIEGFLFSEITIDGDEGTDLLASMINGSKFKDTLRVIFLKGVTIAGFNIIDINRLWKETGLPVVVIMRKEPNFEKIKLALRRVKSPDEKWEVLERAGRIYELPRPRGRIYFQKAGASKKDCIDFIERCTRKGLSNIPESIRISHLVASAVTLGESRRRP